MMLLRLLASALASAALIGSVPPPAVAQTRRETPAEYADNFARGASNIPELSPEARQALRAAIAPEILRDILPLRDRPDCVVIASALRGVDLNGDDAPEAFLSVVTGCREGGRPMGHLIPRDYNWIFVQDGAGWRVNRMQFGHLVPLGTAANGFLLVQDREAVGNPVVYAYDGRAYRRACTVAKRPPVQGTTCPAGIGEPTGSFLPFFDTPGERRRRWQRVASASIAVAPSSPGAATGESLTPATGLTGPALMRAMLTSLRSEVARSLEQTHVRGTATGAYTDDNCTSYREPSQNEFSITPRAVDLNRDAIPEVVLQFDGFCMGGMGSGNTRVFVYDTSAQRWHVAINFLASSLVPLPTRHQGRQGFVDLEAAGPGMAHDVFRFDGERYRAFCVMVDPGGDRGEHTCPFPDPGRSAPAGFAPFPTRFTGAGAMCPRTASDLNAAGAEQLFRIVHHAPTCPTLAYTEPCKRAVEVLRTRSSRTDVVTSAMRACNWGDPSCNMLLEGGGRGGGGAARGGADAISAGLLFKMAWAALANGFANESGAEQGEQCSAPPVADGSGAPDPPAAGEAPGETEAATARRVTDAIRHMEQNGRVEDRPTARYRQVHRTGDGSSAGETLEELAETLGEEVRTSQNGGRKYVQLPGGGTASTYPTSSSGGVPSIQIDKRPGYKDTKIRFDRP